MWSQRIGRAGARLLESYAKDGDTIGIVEVPLPR